MPTRTRRATKVASRGTASEARPEGGDPYAGSRVPGDREEHARLDLPDRFGWRRYQHAGIEVLDAGNKFAPIDLEANAVHQERTRDRIIAAMDQPRSTESR